MKKFYLIIGIVWAMFSCKKDSDRLVIKDFSRPVSTTLEPNKFIPYTMFNLRITGYANDTIRIKTKGIYNLDLRLKGEIDTLWYSDYYGEGPVKCVFDPYKATKGNLEIEIML